MPMTHDEARGKVCAICCNNRGVKACREVSEKEEVIISQEVIKGYNRKNPYLPSGICKGCMFDVRSLTEGRPVKLHLPDSYDCGLERQTRSGGNLCTCRLCWLAKLSFKAFSVWQREVTGRTRQPIIRMCQSCFQGVQEGKHHTCSGSTLAAVQNLAASLPKDVREKLAVETLREKAAETGGGDMRLPQAKGGHTVHVHLGRQVDQSDQISRRDVLTMAASAHLTGKQTDSVLADIRSVLGRKIIEPGVKEARVTHNSQYKEYFSSSMVKFKNSQGEPVMKAFFWCSKLQDFLTNVADKRGRKLEECTLKLGADSGKGFFKLTASIYIPSSPTPIVTKKVRRSREDGVCSERFSETGQRKILLLAWCKDIPESAENLEIIYQAVNISSVSFIMTGDYKLLMPSFGLMSCSSSHPCLYCARARVKGVWEEVENSSDILRSYARIELMQGDWVEAGSKAVTEWTSRFESCTGPILLWGKGDTPCTRILDKVTPPTVHNLLSLNGVLKPHLSNLWPGNMMDDLKHELNIIPHSYQGKDGAFAGPECAKFGTSTGQFILSGLLRNLAHSGPANAPSLPW